MIRLMEEKDFCEVLDMMQVFYASPAVSTNGSKEIFESDIESCINKSPYLEGYVFEEDEIMGYAMLAKSFSTEFGKNCIWIEDLYIKEKFRGRGIGGDFFKFLFEKYKDVVFRLEVEEDNARAVHVYEKSGFDYLPYKEMIKK